MKISIITATWNSGSTLRDTMESVLSQSYENIEHIIVDGLSSDNTMQIIKDMEHRYNGRLIYISERDEGLYDAMNKGISMATGDVVGFLNSDDFYTTDDILSLVYSKFSSNNIDAVYGDVHYISNNNHHKCVRYYSSKFFRRSLMRFGFMPAHPSFYCKRDIYEKYGSFDLSYKIAADFENLLRLIYVNNIKTEYIEKDFVTMRLGGISTNGLNSHKQIMKDHQRAFKANGVYSNFLFELFRYVYKVLELCWSKLMKR